jgi:DNA polymerase-1
MKVIKLHETNPEDLAPFEKEQCYNALDTMVTHDVYGALAPQLDATTAATYEFSKALQGPVLEMRLRGVLVDQGAQAAALDAIYAQMDQLEADLDRLVREGFGLYDFNWRSPKALQGLFYDVLGLPSIRNHGKPTVDRAAREKLGQDLIASQLVRHINTLTELGDRASVLKTSIDPDGRIRTSYNIGGTSTGRFSSSTSEFGTGGNLQNIEESLRSIYVADPGFKFAKCDAKSGESYCVGALEGNLFDDWTYLEACESGDPHTAAARIVWPGLGWTGDFARDKHIAEQPFYRGHSYRFMCKKLGHGSNYGGQPHTLAEQTRLPLHVVQEFQPKYFAAFPAHQRWQHWVDTELRQRGCLTSLTGRKRWFFGRRNEPATLREAIAYDPQGSLADIVNRAMLKLWRQGLTIVMHDHDALTFMYRERDEDRLIPQLLRDLVVPIPLAGGRELRIPYDCETGWNKGKHSEANPNGLKPYSGHDERKRQKTPSILDRPLRGGNPKALRPEDLSAVGSD